MEIKGIIKRTAREGKAIQLDNEQWYSHFSATTGFKEGDSVKVTYNDKQKGDQVYHNWTLIEPLDAAVEVVKPGEPKAIVMMGNKAVEVPYKSNGSMYVSYAKDIFMAMLNKDEATDMEVFKTEVYMKDAIALVKQAKEAFE